MSAVVPASWLTVLYGMTGLHTGIHSGLYLLTLEADTCVMHAYLIAV